jgi:hypothetical protein
MVNLRTQLPDRSRIAYANLRQIAENGAALVMLANRAQLQPDAHEWWDYEHLR